MKSSFPNPNQIQQGLATATPIIKGLPEKDSGQLRKTFRSRDLRRHEEWFRIQFYHSVEIIRGCAVAHPVSSCFV